MVPPGNTRWGRADRYTTSEGITIPVTAPQREIALSNLEEQGMPRPMQYDDPDVPVRIPPLLLGPEVAT